MRVFSHHTAPFVRCNSIAVSDNYKRRLFKVISNLAYQNLSVQYIMQIENCQLLVSKEAFQTL